MNSNVKSLVFNGEEYSDLFLTNVGVRQGVHLFPFLFSLYLNDFFGSNNGNRTKAPIYK